MRVSFFPLVPALAVVAACATQSPEFAPAESSQAQSLLLVVVDTTRADALPHMTALQGWPSAAAAGPAPPSLPHT